MKWSDQLLAKLPQVSRDATLRGLEYAVAIHKLQPHVFAALRKEQGSELAVLQAVMADAKLFCRVVASLPMLVRLQSNSGELPPVVVELLELDDRLYPTVAKNLLARRMDSSRWFAVTESGTDDTEARAYVIELLESVRLLELAVEGGVESGWASRFCPREVGSGQTRVPGSHKWSP